MLRGSTLPNGLDLRQVRVPLGVVGIIYEARPNVTVDAAALCLKSGNAVLLRGSSSAYASNTALVTVLRDAVGGAGLPADAVQLVPGESRESVTELMRARGMVDVLIPRGGAALIRTVVEGSTVPVIETGTGNCHVYVDAEADLDMAVRDPGQLQGPAAQRLQLRRDPAGAPRHRRPLPAPRPGRARRGRGHRARRPAGAGRRRGRGSQGHRGRRRPRRTGRPSTCPTTSPPAWWTRWTRRSTHIRLWSSGHTEAIVTGSQPAARRFTQLVDAAAVLVNASTRFTDGGQFGFGAEIGISTQKLHARGPMGLPELTSTKYIVTGDGHIR